MGIARMVTPRVAVGDGGTRSDGQFQIQRCGGLTWRVRTEDWNEPVQRILDDPDGFLEGRASIRKQKRSRTVGIADGYVVKRYTFRNLETSLKDLFRSSYALRALSKARQLERAGIPAPIPVAAAEKRVMGILLRSYFVMRELPAITPLDEWTGDKRKSIQDLARCLVELHQAGFSHRDMRHRNVVFDPNGRVYLLDLEQVSYVRTVSEACAIADIAWLARDAPNLESASLADRARFLREYCERRGIQNWRDWWRRIERRVAYLNSGGRGAPPPPKRPLKVTVEGDWSHPPFWNRYSDQPNRIPKSAKHRFQWEQVKEYALMGCTAACASPLVLWNCLNVKPMHRRPHPRSFVCLGVSCSSRYNEDTVEMVEELGVEELLVRVPTWDLARLDDYHRFVQQFPGKRFLINILQSRESVTDPKGWSVALRQIFERFQPITSFFQIGNASNRTKWGCQHIGEYLTLLEIAERVRADFPEIKLVGSSVIDFAPLYSARTLINFRDYRLDAASSLLYVNRRGSPFSRQFHLFDLDTKIRVLAAMLRISNRSAQRLWITETNWPLLNTYPYTPNSGNADRTVDEPTQAQYLKEYYQIAYQGGQVEKVYWWQLIAPGYGLVDSRSGTLRKRPSYYAFKDLLHGGLPTAESQ